ncbi:MAG: NapC/NirT family cytochrome c [Lentisphaeria bacterium]|nr:NapC/NirT family cytochrome c [Candidatus Neomarinimicrobiota bacterium]MCF7841308.1 NapC/NirT family cytochrome c [Lentisphaeria bacterium]
MRQTITNFLRGLASNWISKSGVVLVTTSFLLFSSFEIFALLGLVNNAYIGLITYLGFPSIFVIGLMLIPFGWWKYVRETGRSTRDLLSERFPDDVLQPKAFGAKLIRTVAILTLINIVILGAASTRMLHFMDQPEFCGTACHSVMGPEWATYQDSPHAHVKCVDCHVGEGVGALIDSKINGTWQMISVTFDLYERPIPAPVHQLRPARETCEKCHWPSKFHGTRLKTITRYRRDKNNTPKYTTLNLKVGSGENGTASGIHWHIASQNEVRYGAIDDKREKILWVEARQPDGTFKRYVNSRYDANAPVHEERVLDCIDCHNRATHIYELPDKAIDRRINEGLLPRGLPFLKREALAALTKSYPDKETGLASIERYLMGFYRKYDRQLAGTRLNEIDSAITVVQEIYRRNIHPRMNVNWGAYPNHIGHETDLGCFRCHNMDMVDEAGKNVVNDCTTCHSILAYEKDEPFAYLFPVREGEPEGDMHEYLRQEFLQSFDK